MDEGAEPSQQPLSRREALTVLGGLGLSLAVAACSGDSDPESAAPSTSAAPTTAAASTVGGGAATTTAAGATTCALQPEVTEGPYWLTDHPEASNLVQDRKGTLLELALTVVDEACTPIKGAKVDIWHADATGEYAGVGSGTGAAEGGRGGPPPPPGAGAGGGGGAARTNAQNWLQGFQTAGDDGTVRFTTIYPGWYPGRAIHIHLKVFVGGAEVHTGQLFFPERRNSTVMLNAPYRPRPDTTNANDNIFRSAGSAATLAPVPKGSGFEASAQLVVKRS
jgi:protocatechuate 3,4-dioxygenase beta subunit